MTKSQNTEEFTKFRAHEIYREVAEEMGLSGAWFFSGSSLPRCWPPGWIDFINRRITEDELREIAREQVAKIKRILEDHFQKEGHEEEK